MRRILLTSLTFLCCLYAVQAENITKKISVADFSSIKISNGFEITLVKGYRCSVEITIDKEYEEYLVIGVKNGVLDLGLDIPLRNMPMAVWDRFERKAIITMPEIELMELAGAVSLSSEDRFKTDKFEGDFSGASNVSSFRIEAKDAEIEIGGASKINIELDADECETYVKSASKASIKGEFEEFDAKVSGASELNLEGHSELAEYEANSASSIKAYQFRVDEVEAEASSASSIKLHVTKRISDLRTSTGGTIRYKSPRRFTNASITTNNPESISQVYE